MMRAKDAKGNRFIVYAEAEELDGLWKKTLLNQFHDILPGSSMARVYEEAEALYEEILAGADGLTAQARQTLATGAPAGKSGKNAAAAVKGAKSWTVWNSLSWPRRCSSGFAARFT